MTIRNIGSDTLTLDNPTIPTGFSLGFGQVIPSQLPSIVQDTQHYTTSFDLILTGSLLGEFKPVFSLINNDRDENPYLMTLRGKVESKQVSGGLLSNIIFSQGTVCNVELDDDTRLIGGQISCILTGQARSPATIAQAEILENTQLKNVCITPSVTFAEGVELSGKIQLPKSYDYPDMQDYCILAEFLPDLTIQIEGVENVILNVDGTFGLSFFGLAYTLLPTFNTTTQTLGVGERIAPSLISNPDGSVAYQVQDSDLLVTTQVVIKSSLKSLGCWNNTLVSIWRVCLMDFSTFYFSHTIF